MHRALVVIAGLLVIATALPGKPSDPQPRPPAPAFLCSVAGGAESATESSPEKKQNNLVAELLDASAIAGASATLSFTRPTQGWVFISATFRGTGPPRSRSTLRPGRVQPSFMKRMTASMRKRCVTSPRENTGFAWRARASAAWTECW